MTTSTTLPKTMKAINLTVTPSSQYLAIATVADLKLNTSQPFPKPKENQVLVKVHAVAITPYELTWPIPTIDEPRVVCHDIAGTIVTAPKGSGFEEGDRVFGLIQFWEQGGMAEYTVTEPEVLIKMPDELSFVEAASIPRASLTVWHGLKVQGGGVLKKGNNVLILGSTGAVGRMAVQIVREYIGKDGKIVALGGAGGEDAKELGADFFVNYRETSDWAAEVKKTGVIIDVLFDAVGQRTLELALPLISEGGKIVTVGSPPPPRSGIESLAKKWEAIDKAGNGFFFIVDGNAGQLREVMKLVDRGVVKTSISNVVEKFEEKAIQDGWALAMKGGVKGKPGTTVVKIQ